MVEPQSTGDYLKRNMRITCWISKATNTHSEFVMFTTILLQRRLNEPASKLLYTYIASLLYLYYRCFISFGTIYEAFYIANDSDISDNFFTVTLNKNL